ncbi:hypothetical protein [Nocardia vinacea]|uniref:hypothetical protein n=1 Tax=Nocardia vinacea TaxID=96468 RepID=UPI0002F73A97|nr:hypothetical protein [Nocardia vinacea]
MPDDERVKILFTESLRLLEAQQKDFDQIRVRASYLLTAITISTTFLGGSLIRVGKLSALDWAALVAFIIGLLLCAWLVAGPARDWYVGFDPVLAYENYYAKLDPPLTRDEFCIEMLYATEKGMDVNEGKLRIRRWALGIAALALGFEILFWYLGINRFERIAQS